MDALDRISPSNTAAILLAAGASRRFGGDKLGAELQNATVLERSASFLREAGCFRAAGIIAPGRSAHAVLLHRLGYSVLTNDQAADGVSASIKLGVRWALKNGADAVLIALADMPFIPPAHYGGLLEAANQGDGVAYTVCGENRSPPAIFGRDQLSDLLTLSGDVGARSLLQRASCRGAAKASQYDIVDIDTPNDLKAALLAEKKV